MTRYWGVVTLGAAAVPVFGDALAAAFNPPSNGPGAIQLASTARYQGGDRIILAPKTGTAQITLVQSIVDATHLQVVAEGGLPLKSQASGTIIVLANACYEVTVQGVDGGLGALWLGIDSTVTNAGAGTAIYQLAKVAAASQPNSKVFSAWQGSNPKNTDSLWIVGTSTDKYVASFETN